jgi:glycosyltransferase involved in cell wall biosynthesis
MRGDADRPRLREHSDTGDDAAAAPAERTRGGNRDMRLRILNVVATLGHGSGRQVINLSEQLRDFGHEVHLIYSPLGISEEFRTALDRLEGVAKAAVAMRRAPHPDDARAALAIRAYIRRNGPFDVVHGHSSKAGALARLAALGTGAVRAYTPHALVTMDPGLSPPARFVYGIAERAFSWISDVVILVSEDEKREALALGMRADRLFALRPAVKTPNARPRDAVRQELGLAADDVCAGFVGRFVAQKAVERVLAAVAAARRREPRLRLLVVGDGERRDALQAQARRLGLDDNTIWVGEIPSAQVFAAMDIFVLTSRFEGLSAATVEATELGIPVVVTDCGGMGMIVEDGVNGLVVRQSSEEAIVAGLADAIAVLARDRGLRVAMGQRSLERRGAFQPQRVAKTLLGVYQKALAARPIGVEAAAGSRPPILEDYADLSVQRLTTPSGAAPFSAAPLVSVVTATLNPAATIERAIASVQAQTHPAIEHVVVDGGSTDGTAQILQARLRPDDFWISEKDHGISDAFNKGLALARGEFVQIIGADDWMSSDQIACALEALSQSGADFVFGDCICYESGRPTFRSAGDPDWATAIGRRMPTMNHQTMLVRRRAYERFGLYSLAFRNAMDYEWIARAHALGARGVYDPRIVAHMSVDGVSIREFRRTSREVRAVALLHGRKRSLSALEHGWRVAKTGISRPVKKSCRPLYDAVRSTINPAYRPVR